MEHIAIMKKDWGLTDKILSGEKTVESRWYKFKRPPWDKIQVGDCVYFKDTGGPVRVKAQVEKVLQFADLTAQKTEEILAKYGEADLGTKEVMPQIRQYVQGKNYCLLVFLRNPKKVEPFNINKTGFGAMCAWLTVDDVDKIRRNSNENNKKF